MAIPGVARLEGSREGKAGGGIPVREDRRMSLGLKGRRGGLEEAAAGSVVLTPPSLPLSPWLHCGMSLSLCPCVCVL